MKLTTWTAIWIFVIDQISKYVVVQWLDLKNVGSIDVLPLCGLRVKKTLANGAILVRDF